MADLYFILTCESLKFIYLTNQLVAILESLSTTSSQTCNIDNVACILRCLKQFLMLQPMPYSHFEASVSLVSVLCQLLKDTKISTLHSDLLELLDCSVTVLVKGYRSHINKAQALFTLTEKMLKPSLELLSAQPCPVLMDFLLSCLLSEDHHEHYVMHLMSEAEPGAQGKKSAPKSIVNVFNLISDHCIKVDCSTSIAFLPQFLKTFAQSKLASPKQCFLMLKYFVSLIASSRESCPINHQWVLHLVQCIQACQDTDIFSANSETNDIFKWFFQLTELVLEQPRLSPWFQYMRCLLAMNHLVVEKYWKIVFNKCFSPELSDESLDDLDMFLSDLVEKYMKLRRTSDLFSALLSCINNLENVSITLKKMKNFYKSLCQMFTEVPPATLLEIWEKIQLLTEHLVQDSSNELTPGVLWTLAIYSCLLENGRAFEPRIGDVLHRRVCELVKSLETAVLKHLIKKKAVLKLTAVTELLRAWTTVRILLFPRWRENKHSIFESEEIKVLFKQISQALEPTIQVHLSIQRLTLGDSKSAADLMSKQIDPADVVMRLLDLKQLTKQIVLEPWDLNSGTVTPKQVPVVQFYKFAQQLFPLICNILPDTAMERCSQLIVEVLSAAEEVSLPMEQDSTTLLQEVQKFLSRPITREIAKLQQYTVFSVWKKIFATCHTSSKHSPKKKRLRCDTTELVQYLMGDTDHMPTGLTVSDLRQDIVSKPYIKLLITTLGSLDLEYLPHINLRYQLGLLLMLGSLQQEDVSDQDDVLRCVKQNLIKSLSVANLSSLFNCLQPTDLLSYVVQVCSQNVEDSVNNELVLTVVHGVMNDHEAVLKMPQYTKQIVQHLVQGATDFVILRILTDLVKFCQKYVIKSFHIEAVRDSALDIYFTVSKFLIKHGLSWFSESHAAVRRKSDGLKVGGDKRKKGKKRPASVSTGEMDKRKAVMECMVEVLNLWSVHVADTQSNIHLETMVKEIVDNLMKDTQQIQQTETRFLGSCCLCQLHCKQEEAVETSSELTSQKLCFLPKFRLEEIIEISLSKCAEQVTSLFLQLRSTNSAHEDLNTSSSDHHFFGRGDSKSGQVWSLENIEQWPESLRAEVDLLTSAVVCLEDSAFTRLMQNLLMRLKFDERNPCSQFYVIVSLWRGLISSSLLSSSLVKILFQYLYQFLSAFIGCVTLLKSLYPEMPLLQRFVLQGLSDLVDLGKSQVSSRIILLCLDAGVTFTLTSSQDIRALYRLINTLLVHHTNTSLTSVPGILVCSCIKLGSQQNLSSEAEVNEIMFCAKLISRLLIFLSSPSCKVELSKVAYMIVAEYVLGIQEENCHPRVKNDLVKGIYKIMSICDKFRFAALTASLPPGVKDTFKMLHQDFNKYHRYTGQV
ncbi:unhealthy ribosome biogenesis protein 2 [Biomphalaria pfeifferi]|uniref:Unhealthy ribosome biogenesis protein 2 n=1 Tax=Biomphalaria pfeifferi TaxID=112525 RepID=A0AAD8F9Z0_BIOPF|nr:unhealthy ribosome biogenesis protein 2 [Biomphalaria pfeifferi]